MNKPTLIFLLVSTVAMGSLIGTSLVGERLPIAATPFESSAGPGDAGAPVVRYLSPGEVSVSESDDFGPPVPAVDGENFIARDAVVQSETLTIELAADEAVEYKALMKQGDALSFHWSTNGGLVYYDFHGHDESFGKDFFTRYDEGEGKSRAGTAVAAYDGQHGWYWLNLEPVPQTITLDVAGFYDDVVRIDATQN